MKRHRTTTSTEATPYVRSLGDQILSRVAELRTLLNTAHRDVEESALFGNALQAIYLLYREHDNLVQFMSAYSAAMGERLVEIAADALLAIDHLQVVVPIQFTPEQLGRYKVLCEELHEFVTNWRSAVQSQLILAELVQREQS
jgi:hypothetical protein